MMSVETQKNILFVETQHVSVNRHYNNLTWNE